MEKNINNTEKDTIKGTCGYSGSYRKMLKYIDSAIVMAFMTATVIVISYAYNGGYIYYYGIPLVFATTSPQGLIKNIPVLCNSLTVIICACVISIVLYETGSYIIRFKSNYKNQSRLALIGMFVFWLILVCLVFYYPSLSNIFLMIFGTLLFFYPIYSLFKINKVEKKLKALIDQSNNRVIKEGTYQGSFEEIKEKIEENLYINKIPFKIIKPSIFWSLLSIALLTTFFNLSFEFGIYQAKQQKDYYFVAEDKIVVSVYDSYIVAANVSKNNETGEYRCEGKYYLLPMDGLEMKMVKTGQISSNLVKIK